MRLLRRRVGQWGGALLPLEVGDLVVAPLGAVALDLASGDLQFTSITSDELEFRHTTDDTVHLRGQLTFRAHYTRSNYNGSFRYMGVYARRNGAWKLLLSTARRVAAQ